IALAIILTASCKKDHKTTPTPKPDEVVYNDFTYHTVKIGEQTWMVENLRTTTYRDGTPINPDANVSASDADWSAAGNAKIGAWCKYTGVGADDIYGLLYNGYAANNHIKANTMEKSLAPKGWHVATKKDWDNLISYLGAEAGNQLKESGSVHWKNDNNNVNGGNNKSGFKGLPGGLRYDTGEFKTNRTTGFWWAAELGNLYSLSTGSTTVMIGGGIDPYRGHSVRCIMD
ncbi:MAG: fibrobacter succinogenes major paralogous domain-containing protein, partial [Daejeonella sp.]